MYSQIRNLLRPAETVADTMLGLLEAVLAGQMPALADVVQVQQALLRGRDVYEVVGLKQHMEAAHLDVSVTCADMWGCWWCGAAVAAAKL